MITIKVLLVEDSVAMAERMCEALAEIPECQLAGVVDTENAAVASLYKWPIDLVLLDLHLPQGSGFGVLRALAHFDRRPQVVVLTNHDLEEYQTAAIALGASHFLDKARDFDRVPEIIRQISRAGPRH